MLFEGLILDQAQSIGLSANLSDHTKSIDLSDYSCLFIEVYNIHTAKILLYTETLLYGKVYGIHPYIMTGSLQESYLPNTQTLASSMPFPTLPLIRLASQ